MGNEVYKKGLIFLKKDKLTELKAIIKGYKESFDIEYLKNRFHPEKINTNSLKVFADHLVESIKEYKELYVEINELEE